MSTRRIEGVRREAFTFRASRSTGDVSALLRVPAGARALLVFAHGAGAGMTHPFMEAMSERLEGQQLATLRYQFPYMESGRRRPDPQPVLLATVRSAVERAEMEGLPLLAGGKSMGGRMTSLAASTVPLPGVHGIVFFGFPLHPAGRPGTERAAHLHQVGLPMLFLQGTRDALADLGLLTPITRSLSHSASLRIVDGADHGFHVLRRSGRTDAEILDELALAVSEWCRPIVG